jgi:hypothetical protein
MGCVRRTLCRTWNIGKKAVLEDGKAVLEVSDEAG